MPNLEKCNKCGAELELDDSAYDQVFICPNCQADIMIPRPNEKRTVKLTKPVKSYEAVLKPGRMEVVVTDINISLGSAIRLIACFGCASFLLSVVGAIIYFIFKLSLPR
jgi:DNA-directed RNA polymerase subunit RPC12/RpoP